MLVALQVLQCLSWPLHSLPWGLEGSQEGGTDSHKLCPLTRSPQGSFTKEL